MCFFFKWSALAYIKGLLDWVPLIQTM